MHADPWGDCQVEEQEVVDTARACRDVRATLATLEASSAERPNDTLLNVVRLPVRRAAIALEENHPDAAVQLLAGASRFERRYPDVPFFRGRAYLRLGKGPEAEAEFQKIVDHKGASWGARYPLAFIGLAHAAVLAGDLPRAAKANEGFLTLWQQADATCRCWHRRGPSMPS